MKSNDLHVVKGAKAIAKPERWRTQLAIWAPGLIWAGVLFALSSVPGTRYPAIPFQGADKLVHIGLYSPLGFFTARALRRRLGAGFLRTLLLATLIAVFYGVTDELHQAFVPFRSCDWRDLVADLGGALTGAAVAQLRFERKKAC